MSDMSPADALLRSAVKRGVDLSPLRVNADASGGDPAPNVAEGGSAGEEEVELTPVDPAAPKTPLPPKYDGKILGYTLHYHNSSQMMWWDGNKWLLV